VTTLNSPSVVQMALERDGKTAFVVVRKDEAKKVGQKFKWGSGKCWVVVAVIA